MNAQKKTFHASKAVSQTSDGLHYLLYTPDIQGEENAPPLMIFLHGLGERGDNLNELERVAVYGPPLYAQQHPDFPFVLVAPQCPTDRFWIGLVWALDELLDSVLETMPVDPRRLYLTGLSMGAFGAWEWALSRPERFSALVSVCGGYSAAGGRMPVNLCDLRNLPVWAFHGLEDTVVPPSYSIDLIEALKACGSLARLTLYPDRGHDSWAPTYANPDLYAWMLKHEKSE